MDKISDSLMKKIDFTRLPNHVAFIMDGNGRWAKKRGLPRVLGHREGIKNAVSVVEGLVQLKIKNGTLYAFSTENWARPKDEVSALMNIFRENFILKKDLLIENGVKLRLLGEYREFPEDIVKSIDEMIEVTKNNKNLELAIALNYGSRQEIIRVVKKIIEDGTKPEEVDIDLISRNMYSAGMPDPDLLIRTSGEFRISNFLLWQVAYTEFYITEKYWPQFKADDLAEAVIWFQARERRFGGLSGK
ncbi:MAG: polyprenyl diphosphate synthase [bacterium]|nr:polyprenyl diphosphate synthase [bacterium]